MTQVALITNVKVQDGAYSSELLLGKSYIMHGVKRSALFKPRCFAVVKVVSYQLR